MTYCITSLFLFPIQSTRLSFQISLKFYFIYYYFLFSNIFQTFLFWGVKSISKFYVSPFSCISSENDRWIKWLFYCWDSKEHFKNGHPPPKDQPTFTEKRNKTSLFSYSFLFLFSMKISFSMKLQATYGTLSLLAKKNNTLVWMLVKHLKKLFVTQTFDLWVLSAS